MKIDFNVPLLTITGISMVDQKGESVTLSKITIEALLASFEDEKNLAGSEKFARYQLAEKITKASSEHGVGEAIDIPSEDISKIKTLIGIAYATPVVGPAYKLLEGD